MDTIKNRYAGGVCPGCNNERKLISGVNDLATKRPQLVKEWNLFK